MNRKLVVFLGLVAVLIVGAGALTTASTAAGREFQEAAQAPSQPVPSDSVAGEKLWRSALNISTSPRAAGPEAKRSSRRTSSYRCDAWRPLRVLSHARAHAAVHGQTVDKTARISMVLNVWHCANSLMAFLRIATSGCLTAFNVSTYLLRTRQETSCEYVNN